MRSQWASFDSSLSLVIVATSYSPHAERGGIAPSTKLLNPTRQEVLKREWVEPVSIFGFRRVDPRETEPKIRPMVFPAMPFPNPA